ncbi:diacylglycerol/lipid kinase family protein [Peptoniphilus catoniae]|uniref:diacylglycerol/lipid kinase family protein n=1 Tax=Peptoniphilus catoniae TaxID=1660341 RepID=UPI0010FEBCC5|nr:diacylglycerol kinase family protein [Peptoniphilus catoniae]
MKKIMLIVNPNSGKGTPENFKDTIKEKLEAYFDEVDLRVTKGPEDAKNFAEEASMKKYEAICSVGGDGTVNEILQGLYNKDYIPKLAIIPGGTGNLLSKHLEISQDMKGAIEEFDFKKTEKIDLGVCNGKCFSLFVSIGSIPEAIHEVSPEEKSKFGMLTYFKKSIEKLVENEKFNLKITTDEGTYQGPVDHLLVALSNRIGYIKFTDENKGMSTGKANVLILKEKDLLNVISGAKDLIVGEIEKNENVEHFVSKKIKIESLNGSVETDIDGDKGPDLPVEIEILQKRLEVYLPVKK